MFTKGDIRAALSVAIDIDSDATERTCNFSLTGISDGIMLVVYPHGKKYVYTDKYIYLAYQADGYKKFSREFRHGIEDSTVFPSLKEMLKDVKGASDERE